MSDGAAKPSFNENQLKAINHFLGPAMVIAGPGSGKTTVITNRIRALTEERKADPSSILVITFTTSAAAEMKKRYLKLIGSERTQVTFGTFHSVFLNILRTYTDLRAVRLANEAESVPVLKTVSEKYYPGNQFTSDFYTFLLQEISRFKNGLCSDSLLPDGLLPDYDRQMRRRGLMDFDDMLVRCRELLEQDPRVLQALRAKYRFFMIDEFQDINSVQFRCIQLLASPSNNLFVVGDDDQSIYGFRGSDPGIMLSFRSYYADAAFIDLFTNYRSSANIIQMASRLIRRNRSRYEKEFRPVQAKGPRVSIACFADPKEEADRVMESILSSGSEMKSIGVLFRTHRAGSAVFAALASCRRDRAKSAILSEKEIQLLTFHSSKGLEFDIVYIVEACEGITPSRVRERAGMEEERRLFYVAMTRAKKILHISYTKYRYNTKQKKSRFVRELGFPYCLLPEI